MGESTSALAAFPGVDKHVRPFQSGWLPGAVGASSSRRLRQPRITPAAAWGRGCVHG